MTPVSQRRYALIGGMAYLAMTAVALLSLVDVASIEGLPDSGASGAPWPPAVSDGLLVTLLGLAVVILLDLVVAWALYGLFRGDAPQLAGWMALCRVAYAALFALALRHIAGARHVTLSTDVSGENGAAVLGALHRFDLAWDVAFIFFSAHLILLGALIWSDGALRRLLAILLVIAGLGYLADTAIAVAMPRLAFEFAPYTFVGEMALMLWLLFRAGRERPD